MLRTVTPLDKVAQQHGASHPFCEYRALSVCRTATRLHAFRCNSTGDGGITWPLPSVYAAMTKMHVLCQCFRPRPPPAVQTVLTAVVTMLGHPEPTWGEVRRVSEPSQ